MFTNLTDSAKAFLFFVIAFGLTLTVSLLYPLLGQITPFIHMFTPTLSVLIMLLLVTRDGYTKTGWASLGLHGAGLPWWLLALLGPLLVISAVYGLVWSTGVAQARLPDGITLAFLVANFPFGLGMTSALVLGEEIGFRGYLLPRLMHLGTSRALLLSGLLHAIWHFPLMLLTPVYPILGNWFIIGPIFVLTLMAAGVFYGYLQLRSTSVWPATLAHGAVNTFFDLFALVTVTISPLALKYLAGETGVLTLIATVVAAGWLLYRLGQGRRTAQQQIAPRVKANT